MNNNGIANQKYTHSQCAHGSCHNHEPKWEKVGEKRYEPNPGIFGKKTFWKWTRRHCGAAMARYKEIQAFQCQKCGRTENRILNQVAFCSCCGYHFTISQNTEL